MLNAYLNKIIGGYEVFKNKEILEYDDLNTLDLSEINAFRVKNKFVSKDIDGLKIMKNVKSVPPPYDWLEIYLIQFKDQSRFLLAIANPQELYEDSYLHGYQEI